MGFLDKLLGRDKHAAHDHAHDHDHDHPHTHGEADRTVVNHEEQAAPKPPAPAGDAADKV
jgi:hypothetical protein